MPDPVTLTDRIARAAPYGLGRPADKAWFPVLTEGQAKAYHRWQAWDYLTPAQAADALENCKGCKGRGWRPLGEVRFVNRPDPVPCPSCASLRACVEELLR